MKISLKNPADIVDSVKGTLFQKKVWEYVCTIPAGQTKTYQEVAKAIGYPKAARAVGNALNKNPYAPMVPCHRVVRSDGSMGGYALGVKKKEELLREERELVDKK